MKYLLVRPDYKMWVVKLQTHQPVERVIRQEVQGDLEHVRVKDWPDHVGFVNENGKLIGLSPNRLATEMCIVPHDIIVGVLVVFRQVGPIVTDISPAFEDHIMKRGAQQR